MSIEHGPSVAALRRAETLYALLARDASFGRVRRLMEVDWSESATTVEEIGLPRLLQNQARKISSLLAGDEGVLCGSDVADAIRFTERHDTLARDALWWLSELSTDPLLR